MGFNWKANEEHVAKASELLVLQGCTCVTDPKGKARLDRGDTVPEDQLGLRRFEPGQRLKAADLPEFLRASLAANRCVCALEDAQAAHTELLMEYGPARMIKVDGQDAIVGIHPLPPGIGKPVKGPETDTDKKDGD
jgi:hypothetical protein